MSALGEVNARTLGRVCLILAAAVILNIAEGVIVGPAPFVIRAAIGSPLTVRLLPPCFSITAAGLQAPKKHGK